MTVDGARIVLAALTFAVFSSPATAHHSGAMFDVSRQIVIAGVVTEFAWKNPHSYLTIRTEGSSPVEQLIEVGPPATLRPLGLTQDAVRVGDNVSVLAYPPKRGTIALGRELTKADGSVWPLLLHPGSRRPEPLRSASSIQGTWVSQGFFAIFNPNGVLNWPFTAKGRAHFDAQDPLQTSHVRCVPVAAPMLMLYPVTNRIEIDRDVVRMRIDWMESERVIYMDGRGHPRDGERSLHGHSIGFWEADTLVIDTTQFADHSDGNWMFVPSSARKHLIERLTLTEDRRRLRYEFELSDPEWLAQPVTQSALFDYHPELAPSGLPCDPGAAKRFLEE
jgi:hypothetical protein